MLRMKTTETIVDELKQKVGSEGVLRARRDSHARRKPRPCGLTVHPGIGCDARCVYCYIQDLGFEFTKIRPYPLSGEELVLAFLFNQYFKAGEEGTFLAFGSVTEPLHPACLERTMEYLEAVNHYLGNPCQFSTKRRAPREFINFLKELRISINPLITVVSLEKAEVLEPRAPPPIERFEFMRELRQAGLKPILFLRPLIPGVVDNELEDIVEEAWRAGAVGVVAGALRVSPLILARMDKAGVDTREIRRRIRGREGKFLSVNCGDLKRRVKALAERKSLIFFNSACCACAYTAGIPCMGRCWEKGMCSRCPNRCWERVEKN